MTRIKTTKDHYGAVRYTGKEPNLRFPPDGELSVSHDVACEAVDVHDEVEFATGVPRHRKDLRELAANLDVEAINGNSPTDEIVEFLEQFEGDGLELIKRHPEALVEYEEDYETKHKVVPPSAEEPEEDDTDEVED